MCDPVTLGEAITSWRMASPGLTWKAIDLSDASFGHLSRRLRCHSTWRFVAEGGSGRVTDVRQQ